MVDWVLSEFPKDSKSDLDEALKNAVEAVKLIVDGDIDKAMNLYNS